jgi:DNA-3-methyladenine glycosylase II
VLPVGDFGVRSAIQRAYRKRKLPTAKEIEKLAKNWRPYCSFAAWYLWRSLELPVEKTGVRNAKSVKNAKGAKKK